MKLIGLTGKAGAGKTSVANHLVERYGYRQYALASPIKDMLWVGLGLAPNVYEVDREAKERVIPELGVSYRQLCQELGTEFARRKNNDIWLHRAECNLAGVSQPVVIGDLRFENEAAWVRSKGGRVVHVFREGHSGLEGVTAQHSSESGIQVAEGDYTIFSPDGLTKLYKLVDELMAVLALVS